MALIMAPFSTPARILSLITLYWEMYRINTFTGIIGDESCIPWWYHTLSLPHISLPSHYVEKSTQVTLLKQWLEVDHEGAGKLVMTARISHDNMSAVVTTFSIWVWVCLQIQILWHSLGCTCFLKTKCGPVIFLSSIYTLSLLPDMCGIFITSAQLRKLATH